MTESFAALFEESELNLNVEKGAVIQGVVVNIDSDWVTVDTGLKSEGIVDRAEFLNEQRELEVQVGDTVDVVVEALDNGMGQTVLSREKAKRAETWTKLEKIFEDGEIVTGVISGKVKGGFTVDIGPVRAFLPGSLVDTRPIRDTTHLEGKELEFKVIKLDAKRNNVVVSRRAVMEAESSADREALLAQLEEGQTVTGTIKTLLITVHSLILAVLMVFYISQIWLGSVSSTLQKLLKLVKKLLLKYLNLTVNVTAYL